jgi:hypothetical protein
MSMNPYESPPGPFLQPPIPAQRQRQQAEQSVAAPAMALMVVSGICLALMALCIPFDLFLLTSGFGARLRPRAGMDPSATIFIRMTWSVLLLFASGYVFFGAMQMKQLASYTHARAAAIVACIPCVGPCCLLGIPFGAWALAVLGQPEVAKAFER